MRISSRSMLAVVVAGVGALVVATGLVVAGPPDPESGRAVFVDKQCDRCHRPRGDAGSGPALEDLRRPQGAMELAGRLWNHVPGMLATVSREGLEWQKIDTVQMDALMAYLQAQPSRDPAPDVSRGQVVLVRKGCLKCHSLRREGGRVEPDLADRRADYESPAAWAAAMWTHTPRMAAMAERQGVAYPRFAGDEMGNLLGYLKSVAIPPAPGKPGAARGQ
jgi:cytochrome c2